MMKMRRDVDQLVKEGESSQQFFRRFYRDMKIHNKRLEREDANSTSSTDLYEMKMGQSDSKRKAKGHLHKIFSKNLILSN